MYCIWANYSLLLNAAWNQKCLFIIIIIIIIINNNNIIIVVVISWLARSFSLFLFIYVTIIDIYIIISIIIIIIISGFSSAPSATFDLHFFIFLFFFLSLFCLSSLAFVNFACFTISRSLLVSLFFLQARALSFLLFPYRGLECDH